MGKVRESTSPDAETIGASEFRRRCLELLDEVQRRGRELIITKRGEPLARVVPIRGKAAPLHGLWRDRIVIHGDIVHIDWTDEWKAAR